ncbi:unnamed protein product [Miscanthus lutarioriparius]|uniref:Uncharacterized protein n=1 Tax=Miscanthus lutarioriparius TaxID=422564 RepID=A0A811R8E1_9POAL|nr:unnamed protein product [Miscanthus lutarioriparius]
MGIFLAILSCTMLRLPVSAGNDLNSIDSDILKENELGNVELLELERRELIGEILRLNPGYKTPENYKPVLKESKVPLPAEAHPGHNIIGVLLGPESNTQKRLHEVWKLELSFEYMGLRKSMEKRVRFGHQDINEVQDAYEDLYINVSADSYDKVDAAVVLIELLLAPVSVKSTATSTTTAVPSAVTSKDAVSANVQLVNLLHMNSMPRNPFPVPGPQQSTPSNQQHPPQFRANNSSIGPSFGHPPGIRPLQASPTFYGSGDDPISVSPVGATPPQGPIALTPSNMPTMYAASIHQYQISLVQHHWFPGLLAELSLFPQLRLKVLPQ